MIFKKIKQHLLKMLRKTLRFLEKNGIKVIIFTIILELIIIVPLLILKYSGTIALYWFTHPKSYELHMIFLYLFFAGLVIFFLAWLLDIEK